jgi:hypothetical protein
MSKVLNVVFGIGIAVVIYILVLLGIQAFYPAPQYQDFCNQTLSSTPYISGYDSCADNITVGTCRASMKVDNVYNKEMQKCSTEFDNANKTYGKNLFIITSIIGVIIILIAFFLSSIASISAGITISGIVLIMFGFIRGWQGTDDRLKFVVGLIVAAIIIFLAIKVNKRTEKKITKKKK